MVSAVNRRNNTRATGINLQEACGKVGERFGVGLLCDGQLQTAQGRLDSGKKKKEDGEEEEDEEEKKEEKRERERERERENQTSAQFAFKSTHLEVARGEQLLRASGGRHARIARAAGDALSQRRRS